MTIDPFDGKKVDKVFDEARKFYKELEKEINGGEMTPADITKYQKEINDYSTELVVTLAKEADIYKKGIDAQIKEEVKRLEQQLQTEKKRNTAVLDDYLKERSALCQQGVKLYEKLKKG
jgi:uncharacterized protein YoxC